MEKTGKIGAFLLLCLTRPLALLPLSFHQRAGRRIGRFIGRKVRYRRDVVMTNLSRSFPEKKYDELRDICNRFYEYLGRVIGEAVWFGASSAKKLKKTGIARIVNPEEVNRFYREGHSVYVLASHNGNWEIYGGYASYGVGEQVLYPEKDICMVYRQLSSKAWDRFMYRNRIAPIIDNRNYHGLVETFEIMRYAFNNRKEAKLYNFITDQHPYSESSKVPVRRGFLGQETFTMNGGAALAKILGMPVVYMNMKIADDRSYEIKYTPICDNAADMEIDDIMDRYYELLEQDIKEQPWNYLWSHKRWK